MFHRFATSVTAVYCRFRLSKNEFRKCRYAKRQSSVVTKTIRVEQASQEHDLTQPFPGSCTPSVSIPINAVAVTSWECHYNRLPSLSVFLFPYMY